MKILTVGVLVLLMICFPLSSAESPVVITETESNPQGTDAGNEWVKLFNSSNEQIDVSGWSLKSTHGKTVVYNIPNGKIIQPCSELKITFPSQFLDNEDESVILSDSNGNMVDKTSIFSDKENNSSTWIKQRSSCTEQQIQQEVNPPEQNISKTYSDEQTPIPNWVKNIAGWWAEGKTGKTDFVNGIRYLMNNDIIQIPDATVSSNSEQDIPPWIKNTALWWSQGLVEDKDFVSGIQFMIENGVMSVYGDDTQSCKGNQLCVEDVVQRVIDGDTLIIGKYTVRLSLVDTPEKDEIGFKEATAFTSKSCRIGAVAIFDQDDLQPLDQYEREVGKVTCSGINLNEQLLLNEHAEILTQYCVKSEFANEDWARQYGC